MMSRSIRSAGAFWSSASAAWPSPAVLVPLVGLDEQHRVDQSQQPPGVERLGDHVERTVLERLRVDPLPPPVLVVSAKSSPGDMQRARDLGAADYLAKPYDPAELLRRVAALLG